MSVVKITRKIALEGGNAAIDAVTQQWQRRETYQVQVDSPDDTLGTILAHPGIPPLRSPHPDGAYLRVSRQDGQRRALFLWEVYIDYITPQGSGGGGGESPLLKAPIIEYSSEVSEEDVDQDVEGNPILFVTGEEPDPKLREQVNTPLIIIKRNVLWVNPGMIADYRNKYNSDTWYGNPPGTCLIRSLHATSVEDVDFDYFMVTASIAIRRGAPNTTDAKAWWRRVRAQGFLVNLTGPGLFGFHAQKNGAPVTKPVLHDKETGAQITNNADAQWYEWDTKGGRPFAALGLI